MTPNQILFVQACDALLRDVGMVPKVVHGEYEYNPVRRALLARNLPTVFVYVAPEWMLEICIMDGWLAGTFDMPMAARRAGALCNPDSGKWNFHFWDGDSMHPMGMHQELPEFVALVRAELERIIPKKG
jgi:hypothetical protein